MISPLGIEDCFIFFYRSTDSLVGFWANGFRDDCGPGSNRLLFLLHVIFCQQGCYKEHHHHKEES